MLRSQIQLKFVLIHTACLNKAKIMQLILTNIRNPYASSPGAPKTLGGDNLYNLADIFYSSICIVAWATTSSATAGTGGTSTLGGGTVGYTPASVPL